MQCRSISAGFGMQTIFLSTSLSLILKRFFQVGWLEIRGGCGDQSIQQDNGYVIYRGSYMSAHVLLNLLNELRKRDQM